MNLSFWEQFLIMQASSALQAVLVKYASRYFTPEESAAAAVVVEAVVALPQRIHEASIAKTATAAVVAPLVGVPAK